MSELQDVNDWVTFGLYLGIKMPRLEAIKLDCPTLGERRTQLLNEWQKKVTPTWSAVVQALAGIGMRRLASELAQKHGWLNSDFFLLYGNASYIFTISLNSGASTKLPDNDPLDQLLQLKEEVKGQIYACYAGNYNTVHKVFLELYRQLHPTCMKKFRSTEVTLNKITASW